MLAGDDACRELCREWRQQESDGASGSVIEALADCHDAAASEERLQAARTTIGNWMNEAVDAEQIVAVAALAARGLAPRLGGDALATWAKALGNARTAVEEPRFVAMGLVVELELERHLLGIDGVASLIERIITLIPDGSELERLLVRDLALSLARRGMLQGAALALDLPATTEACDGLPGYLRSALFIDAVECGRIDWALELWQRLDRNPGGAISDLVSGCHEIARWMVEGEADPLCDNPMLAVFEALRERDMAAIEEYAEDIDQSTILGDTSFFSLAPVRLALARLDVPAARGLLERRRECLVDHYLDDLMWARLALLENRPRQAAAAYARCASACDRYRARERLDWELQLAAECRPNDLVALGGYRPDPSTPAPPRLLTEAVLVSDRILLGLDPSVPPAERWIGVSAAAMQTREWIVGVWPIACCHGPDSVGKVYAAQLRHRCRRGNGRLVEIDAASGALLGWQQIAAAIDEAAGGTAGTLMVTHAEALPAALQERLLRAISDRSDAGGERGLDIVLVADRPPVDLVQQGRWSGSLAYAASMDCVGIPPGATGERCTGTLRTLPA